MGSIFDKTIILDRIKEYYKLEKRADLARFLGIAPNTLTNWYMRNTLDLDVIYTKCVDMDYNWLFGTVDTHDVNTDEKKLASGENPEDYLSLENPVKGRINEIISCYCNNKKSCFSQTTGLSPAVTTNITGGRGNFPSFDALQKILSSFPNINPDWLIFGTGSMLRNESENPLPSINQDCNGSPYYNVDFIGGFDILFNDQTINPDFYINYPPYNKEGVVWVNLTGHSMEPELSNGDIIALKPMNTSIEYLPTNEIYAIITEDYRTVKRIELSDRAGFVRLIPSNKEFKTQEIPIQMITKVYAVLGSIRKFF